MAFFDLSKLRSLPEQDARELSAQHDAEIQQLLPVLGPLFGMSVISFSIWDYLIEPSHALTALPIRIAFVLLGSIAYISTRLPWTPVQRCGHIFWTHVSAIIICEFLSRNGFVDGLAGIVACVFTVSVVTLRIRTFVRILSVPTVLFVVLSAIKMPTLDFVTGLMLYFFSVSLAFVVMLTIRSFRQRAYLLEKKLLHVSRHDSLTGACNRGYLTELAKREVELSRRHGGPLAAAMLDIDHFKKVNDNYGHDIGDTVIQLLVTTCQDNLRVIDHFGRIGGEEFVCVLPETGEADAMLCAERLRQAVEALCVETPQGPLQFTISIGVAMLNPHHADWHALLKDADTALYRAKREGRNRVVLDTQ